MKITQKHRRSWLGFGPARSSLFTATDVTVSELLPENLMLDAHRDGHRDTPEAIKHNLASRPSMSNNQRLAVIGLFTELFKLKDVAIVTVTTSSGNLQVQLTYGQSTPRLNFIKLRVALALATFKRVLAHGR